MNMTSLYDSSFEVEYFYINFFFLSLHLYKYLILTFTSRMEQLFPSYVMHLKHLTL